MAFSVSWTDINVDAVSLDHPASQAVMKNLRANIIFNSEWMGDETFAMPAHAHAGLTVDGTNVIPGASGGVQITLQTISFPKPNGTGTSGRGEAFTRTNMKPEFSIIYDVTGPVNNNNGGLGYVKFAADGLGIARPMGGGLHKSDPSVLDLIEGGVLLANSSGVGMFTTGNLVEALCLKSRAGFIDIGTYVGDGSTSHPITGVGLLPKFVWIVSLNNEANGEPIMKITGMAEGAEGVGVSRGVDGTWRDNAILTFDADGFTVGSNDRVNEINDIYGYVVIADGAFDGERALISTYVGTGSDNEPITGSDLTPTMDFLADFAIVLETDGTTSRAPQMYTRAMADYSMDADASIFRQGMVQRFLQNGMQLGTQTEVNTISKNYAGLFLKGGIFRW